MPISLFGARAGACIPVCAMLVVAACSGTSQSPLEAAPSSSPTAEGASPAGPGTSPSGAPATPGAPGDPTPAADAAAPAPSSSASGVDGGGPVPPPPPPSPTSPSFLRFADDDLAAGKVRGRVVIGAALDESQIVSYTLYWASGPTTPLSVITSIPKTGADLSYELVSGADSVNVPAGATHLLAVAVPTAGAASPGVSLGSFDDVATTAKIEFPPGITVWPSGPLSAAIDKAANKLLIAGAPGLFRCELDGTACTFTNLAVLPNGGPFASASLSIDEVAGRVYVGGSSLSAGTERGTPRIFRCQLDGTACIAVAVSPATTDGWHGTVVVDHSGGRVVFPARDSFTSVSAKIFSCDLDLTTCTSTPMFAAGTQLGSPGSIAAIRDPSNGTLLIGFTVGFNSTAGLAVCPNWAGPCTGRQVSANAGQPNSSGHTPSPALDLANGKLLLAVSNGVTQDRSGLYRCLQDGTGCSYLDISAGAPAASGLLPSPVVDPANGRLLVATTNGFLGNRLGLIRCALEGTACRYLDASAGLPADSGVRPTALLDADHGKLRVVARSGAALQVTTIALR